MPIAIKNITGSVLDNFIGEVYGFGTLCATIQTEDYINLNGFVGYLQTYDNDIVQNLSISLMFGLKNQYKISQTTLEISY